VRDHSEAFIGIDTSKLRNAIEIAEGGRGGEMRHLGEIDSVDAATRKLVSKLAGKYRSLTFCYEAGPTGFRLYRLIRSLGYEVDTKAKRFGAQPRAITNPRRTVL
jgi:transposase